MRAIALLTAFLLAVLGHAQSGFSGVITKSGSPVSNARLTLFTPDLARFFETRSNVNGAYSFLNVPSGPYRLGVAFRNSGYQEILVDTNGGVQERNFQLSPETEPGRWDVVGTTAPEFFDGTDIAVLLGDGRIFFCHDTMDPVVFDPITGAKSFPAGSGLPSGCMNGTLLANGEVFFVGGQEGDDPGNFRLAVRYVRAYSAQKNSWRFFQDLLQPNGRWYPGMARLNDGSVLVMGGGTRPDAARTNTCERFNLATETWGWTGSMLNPCEFPPNALLYNGKVLATWSPPQLYDPATGLWQATGNFNQPDRGWPNHSDHSIVVMSDGKVLALGIRGGTVGSQSMGEIYDPTLQTWTRTSNPGLIRFQTEVVQLPDGRVLSAGGESTNPNPPVSNVLNIVKWSDLYDPALNAWRRVADMNWFREYHAVTLLVPDGRVLMTGGTKIKFQYGPTSADIEAFVPPYLLRGVRPQITSLVLPMRSRGGTISMGIAPATKITSVVLMGAEVTTHWVNAGIPRRLELPVTQNGSVVTVKLPTDPNVLPLGRYMLFAMVDDIPSVGRIVSVTENKPVAVPWNPLPPMFRSR